MKPSEFIFGKVSRDVKRAKLSGKVIQPMTELTMLITTIVEYLDAQHEFIERMNKAAETAEQQEETPKETN